MARFLCQLCYTVVHYGERHPCFIYKSDEDFYTIPNLDETDITHEESENRMENLNDNFEEIISETQKKDVAKPQQMVTEENKMSPISTQRRSRKRKTRNIPAKVSGIDNDPLHEIDSMNERHTNLSEPEATLLAGPSTVTTRSLGIGNEVRFVCGICFKDFARKAYFQKHLKTHTGDKPYECGECGKRFRQKHHLRDHIRIHTGDKPFICGECGERFAKNFTLQGHIRIHTGEKPYACEWCGHKFTTGSGLSRHCKRKHAEGRHSP